MKSVKLSGCMQDDIRNTMLKPLREKRNEAQKRVEKFFLTQHIKELPPLIREMLSKYPNSLYTNYSSDPENVPEDCATRIYHGGKKIFSLGISGFVNGFPNAAQMYKSMDEGYKEQAHGYMREVVKLDAKIKKLDNQIKCALGTLKTTAKLRDEFPEAYEIYLIISGESKDKSTPNRCDAVEELRAELSAINTENKK
ncbi:MAG: hypothetical protein RR382_04730 [Tannerellaceae bacterium]